MTNSTARKTVNNLLSKNTYELLKHFQLLYFNYVLLN